MSSCRSQGFAPAGALALLLVAACGDNGTAPTPAPATTLAFRPVSDGQVRTTLRTIAGIVREQQRELAELRAVRQMGGSIRWPPLTARARGTLVALGGALRRG